MSKKLLKLIPSRVQITNKVSYEVLWIKEFKDASQMGECRPDTKQILIKEGLTPTEAYKTYVHELFHSFSFEYPEMVLTERQVGQLEEAYYRYQKLNKLI